MNNEPSHEVKHANNMCQSCLFGAMFISTIFCSIVLSFKYDTDAVMACAFANSIVTYIAWRILVKRKYGQDAFEG